MKKPSKLSWGERVLLYPCLLIVYAIAFDTIWFMTAHDQVALLNEIGSGWFMYTVVYNHRTLRRINQDGQHCRVHTAWPRDRTCVLRGDHVMPDTSLPTQVSLGH